MSRKPNDDELLLLGASVGGAIVASAANNNGLSQLVGGALQSSPTQIQPGGSISIDVVGENTVSFDNQYVIGATLEKPDGTRLNLPSVLADAPAEQQFSGSIGPRSTGSLSPRQGGPDPNRELFDQIGNYTLIVSVFNDRGGGGPDASFNGPLFDRLATQTLEDVIEVKPSADASVASVSINGSQVL